ncbi:hypothetical protein ACIQPT_25505 [Streptomyces sp. NPDC091289]|uniref:hypothetical protein n=1 Tax=Streptomyces sp. NPDC091289 TaxID=3365989 RepID=UPI00381ED629
MKIAGFFEELWPPSFGAPVGSMHDFTLPTPHEDSEGIVKYLLAGHSLFSVMGSSQDILGSGETVLSGDSIFSDGDWIWRGDLWFYVRKHYVRLPDEFLARMREKQYAIPAENDLELWEISREVHDGLTAE